MKIKTKKRQGRAARRTGACKRCARVESMKLPEGAKNHVSAPCAKCGRVLRVDWRIIERPDDLAAFIQAVSPFPDVCLETFQTMFAGDLMPSEDTPFHCEKAHVLIIKNWREDDREDDEAIRPDEANEGIHVDA